MKVLFFAQLNDKEHSGVAKKVRSQAQALGELGEDVFLFLLAPYKEVVLYRYNSLDKSLGLVKTRVLPSNPHGEIKKYKSYKDGYLFLRETLLDHAIDAVYFRKIPPFPFVLRLFKEMRAEGIRILFEYPTYPYFQELLSAKEYKNILLEILFQNKLRRMVDHFFIITDSVSAAKISVKNWTRFSNGFDVDSVRKKNPSNAKWQKGEPLHCLAVANVSFWHGLDRMVKGLAIYRQMISSEKQPIFLHVVGNGNGLVELKEIVRQLALEEHVFFHGPLYGPDLDTMFDRCHIGVGSLGIHRIGLKEASILKAREYCARGIPFILAAEDPDFTVSFKFIKKFPSDDTPISMEGILDFAEQILIDNSYIVDMRAYAFEYLSWEKKMRIVQDYL